MKLNPLLRSLVDRFLNPRFWSLRARVVYTTGIILFLGAFTTLFTISSQLHQSAEEIIESKIENFHLLVFKHLEGSQDTHLILNVYLANMKEFKLAFAGQEIEDLQNIIRQFEIQTTVATGRQIPVLQLYTTGAVPLYNSRSMNPLGNIERNEFQLPLKAEEKLKPYSGLQVIGDAPYLSCALPVFVKEIPIGILESFTPLSELFSSFVLPAGYGLEIIPTKQGAKQDGVIVGKPYVKMGKTISDAETLQPISKKKTLLSSGALYGESLPLKDWQQANIATIRLYYDGTDILRNSRDKIIFLSWLTIVGVFLLSLSLYWNVKRIRDFFNQMKTVLIASQSKGFSQRIDTVGTHCIEVIECSNTQCPVYKNPEKICYLETGDEAISPAWRNFCIHLKKYKTCKECPVYKKQAGDELAEMGSVVNTMMDFWDNFLEKIGTLLSDVFHTGSVQIPGLDDISRYLEQMAALTAYSQDIQGVQNKEEVFSLFEWFVEKQFRLARFNLLEINSTENQMGIYVDRFAIEPSHLEVFVNCELCRAKRVAQDVSSAGSPFLCPYFGVDVEKDVRYCMPLVMGGKVGAVFTFVVEREVWETVRQNIPFIRKCLDDTAPILSSLKLLQVSQELALRDSLTLCHNRRFMDEYLTQLETQVKRKPRKIGFIMADLDHFKMVNDEYGHLAGDEVLRQLAMILRSNIREADLFIRYGGEEFLIILMDISDNTMCNSVAEKLRIAVEEAKFTLPSGGSIQKTMSLGTSYFPEDADQFYQIIKYADVALYKAKESGRNKVLSFSKEMWGDDRY